MAKQVVAVVESMTGELLTEEATTRVWLTVEGQGEVELALSPKSLEAFRKTTAPYWEAETPTAWEQSKQAGGKRTTTRETTDRKTPTYPDGYLAAVRAWAAEQGIEVAPKGLVRREVREAYDQAQAEDARVQAGGK